MSASRWVSRAYASTVWGASRAGVCVALGSIAASAALLGNAPVAQANAGETAQGLIAEVERDTSARELVGPVLIHAKEALSRKEGASPRSVPWLESTALEWAEVARDLVRASAAERASDRLEQDASAVQTEIARLRAAVEQTMARVGRARQELKELEGTPANATAGASARKAAAAPIPAPESAPGSTPVLKASPGSTAQPPSPPPPPGKAP